MPRAKQRTPELRRRVLDVAVQTLADEGVAGFTTRKVAERADTSIPAVYELFGARAGLVREVFFEGFRQLGGRFSRLRETADPRADVLRLVRTIRAFAHDNPELAAVMFSRPFADFDPGPSESEAGRFTREFIVGRVRRCIAHNVFRSSLDPVDAAHALLALVHGLMAQEQAGILGTSKRSVDRRWSLAADALLDGLTVTRQG